MDDSGTRHPDRKPGRAAAHGRDWFVLGGILIAGEDEESARGACSAFCSRWGITAPLHSRDIRASAAAFAWIGATDEVTRGRFMTELSELMLGLPVVGHACVIDRPGYNYRYLPMYGRKRWLLCRTAFSIAVERAAKFARSQRRRLRVFVERGDPKTDRRMREYYNELCRVGLPFAVDTSSKYAPLTSSQFAETLYEFRVKHKTSPMMQVADLYLWPICIGGYDPNNRPFAALRERGKLIDARFTPSEVSGLGIKYSCWDLVDVSRV
jgi:hypothetical protein